MIELQYLKAVGYFKFIILRITFSGSSTEVARLFWVQKAVGSSPTSLKDVK